VERCGCRPSAVSISVQQAPLVTVYMPTRNRSHLLRRAVESVRAQTFTNFELIVVNDCSTDETRSMLDGLASTDTRIKAIHLEEKAGAPAARNRALFAAQGALCTGLDDDDEFLSSRLADLVGAFEKTHSLVCTGMRFDYGVWSRTVRDRDAIISLEDELTADQVGTQMLTLTERLRAVGGFDPTMPAWQDYDLWTRLIATFGPAKRIAKVSYVQHFDSDNERISRFGALGAKRFIEKHGDKMNATQVSGHELEALMIEQRPLRMTDFLRLSNRKTIARAVRYLITSNIPLTRSVARVIRIARHRPDSLPR
jgi:glycosyltransferase involved in cell wall biosynthesis